MNTEHNIKKLIYHIKNKYALYNEVMSSHDNIFSSNKEHDALNTTMANNITKLTHYIISSAYNTMHTNQYVMAYMP